MTQTKLFNTFECECGFKGNTLEIEKHFRKTWNFVNHKVEKLGHQLRENL